jgi:uncharacterized protein involved in type VI secretion and phage assembly
MTVEASRRPGDKATIAARERLMAFDAKLEWQDALGRWSTLRVLSFVGEEQLSRPFSFTIEAGGPDSTASDAVREDEPWHPPPGDMVGCRAVLSWGHPGSIAPWRYLSGEIAAVVAVDPGAHRIPYLELVLSPPLLRAMHNRRSRVFQRVDRGAMVVEKVLRGDVAGMTGGFGEVRDDCNDRWFDARPHALQVDESDFAFASRTLEALGVTYHFEHRERGVTMVLRDEDHGREKDEHLREWGGGETVRSFPGFLEFRHGARAEAPLFGKRFLLRGHSDILSLWWGPNPQQWGDDCRAEWLFHERSTQEEAQRQARREGERAAGEWGEGETSYPSVRTGTLLIGREDSLHLVEGVRHALSPDHVYRARVRTRPLPARGASHGDRVHRPQLLTPRPRIDGVIRAEVTGADREDETFERELARMVEVRLSGFEGSCWALLAQPVANGTDEGIVAIPRVGTEVLVAFEGGNPDFPYIVGSVRTDQMDGTEVRPPGPDDPRVALQASGARISLGTRGGRSHLCVSSDGRIDIAAPSFSQEIDQGKATINLGSLEIHASSITLIAGRVTLDAGMVTCPGLLKCDTLVAKAVVASSYTPGAGNVW